LLLRVVHITESITASAGGTSTAFVELIEALRTQSASGLELRAISQTLPPDDAARKWIAGHEPNLWHFTGPRGRHLAGTLASDARRLIDEFKPHILHLHGLWCQDLVSVARHALGRGIATCYHPHGMLVHAALRRSVLKKAIFRRMGLAGVLAKADAVVFATDGERVTSDLSMFSHDVQTSVIPLAVNVEIPENARPALAEAGRARLGLAADEPALVFMGRLHPVKRVELTIDAFAKARQSVPGLKLILVGDGDASYVESLRVRAAALGVGLLDAITFAGWLSGDAKWQALAAADALIINSEFENFCYALVEALIVQTPVIMTDNLAMAPAAQNAGAGFMATSDPDALAAAITRLLAISTDRASMGARGRAWVEASFSRPAVGAALVRLYQSISKEPVAP